MKILKVKSRKYKGKQYHKYRINIPESILQEADLKEGDELDVEVKDKKIVLSKR